jgi:hypothetical protein
MEVIGIIRRKSILRRISQGSTNVWFIKRTAKKSGWNMR